MSRSSFPRNISGQQQVEITNFHTAPALVKGQTDITKPDTLTPLLCSSEGKLEVNTNIGNKLPDNLTGSGNLKVCIQELGNEGSERLNVDIGDSVSSKLPTQLTGSGNLKVSIQETFGVGLATESTQTDGTQKTQIVNNQDILSYITTSWTSGTFSDAFNCLNASKIRLYGNIQTTDTLQIQYASSFIGGVYDWIFATDIVPITTIDGSICIDMVIDCPPPYIRLKNNSATNQSVSLRVVKH